MDIYAELRDCSLLFPFPLVAEDFPPRRAFPVGPDSGLPTLLTHNRSNRPYKGQTLGKQNSRVGGHQAKFAAESIELFIEGQAFLRTHQPVDQPANLPADQSPHQPAHQPADQPANLPVDQSTHQPSDHAACGLACGPDVHCAMCIHRQDW